MLRRRFMQLFTVKTFVNTKLTTSHKKQTMSAHKFRVIFSSNVSRFLISWSRSSLVSNVFRRCRKDAGLREVLYCFRQAFMRPRRTLLLSATAAYKKNEDETSPPCEQSITDMELEKLMSELEAVEKLSHQTLYCAACGKRLVIDRKHAGIRYCTCKTSQTSDCDTDGWEPYMEAEDVIIWRKEYRPGQGLYAYKVYGRYNEVWARDFAAIQVDGEYRKAWDSAVAGISVVEDAANGVQDQAVVHWEVLWPRMFANRDYVYIRRHKTFDVTTQRTEPLFSATRECVPEPDMSNQRPSVHSRAKRKSLQNEQKRSQSKEPVMMENKAYIIVSRSCQHPQVPETKSVVRVTEYWSHMCVRTLRGADQPGMEFVLTYYDDPGVGGVGAMAAWATGRAAPAYLDKMRRAAADYTERGYSIDKTLEKQRIEAAKKKPTIEHQESIPVKTESETTIIVKQGIHKNVSAQDIVHTETKLTIVNPEISEKAQISEKDEELSEDSKISGEAKNMSDKQEKISDKQEKLSDKQEKVSDKQEKLSDKQEKESEQPENISDKQKNISKNQEKVSEQPENQNNMSEREEQDRDTTDKSTQTEMAEKVNENASSETPQNPKESEDAPESNGTWWKYLYPFYYFI